MRVISRPDEVVAALEDPAYTVPPVAPARTGVAWLRSHVARFSEGAEHERRRALAVAILDKIDPDSLRTAPGDSPTAILAAELGLNDVVDDVGAIAPVYLLGENAGPDADAAVERLVEAFGGVHDEETAARIGLLVQAHTATAALVAKAAHPVPGTRRLDPDGDLVFLDFTQPGGETLTFGAGRHRCPGKAHALAIADHDRLR